MASLEMGWRTLVLLLLHFHGSVSSFAFFSESIAVVNNKPISSKIVGKKEVMAEDPPHCNDERSSCCSLQEGDADCWR
jgi:hypothetical protein